VASCGLGHPLHTILPPVPNATQLPHTKLWHVEHRDWSPTAMPHLLQVGFTGSGAQRRHLFVLVSKQPPHTDSLQLMHSVGL
jgi:hypothetical protein